MDSASSIAKRTAGRVPSVPGAKFTFANGTTNAETVAARWLSIRRASGYRDTYHRAHGEGPAA